jgi:hypothetical protein
VAGEALALGAHPLVQLGDEWRRFRLPDGEAGEFVLNVCVRMNAS